MSKQNALIFIGMIVMPMLAQSVNGAESADINQLKQLLSQQSKQLDAQQKVLDAQNQQLKELQSRFDSISGDTPTSTVAPARKSHLTNNKGKTPSSPEVVQTPRTLGEAPKQQQAQAAPNQPRLKAMPKDTRPPEIPRVSADVGGVLTPHGRIVVEPTIQYSYSKAQRVGIEGFTVTPILFGIFNVRDVRRETQTYALTGRYGLTDRIELETRIPYVNREDTTESRIIRPAANDEFFNAEGSDIGDIEVAGHYQFNDGKNGWPFFIGNLRFKTDTGTSPFDIPIDLVRNLPAELNTGTGFLSFQPSVTAIYPTDPAVFFGNVSYMWNLEKNIRERIFTVPDGNGGNILIKSGGKTDPGDALGFSFGTSLAYNEKASFSLGYSHTIYFKTEQDGAKIDGTDIDVGQFTFGLNYAFAKKTSANLAVAIGATRDAPDVQMTLRVPFGFDM
ncbi:hypothetical protein MCAMS1_00174 [biofilm metagenome]